MSISIMAKVWEIDLSASQKIVLLALADCANDEGLAWPGMASLSRKCSKSERTVQAMLGELEAAGHISRVQVPGRGCRYTVHPRKICTPAKSAPPQNLRKPPQNLHPTPAKSAPKPSYNHQEPSKRSRAAAKPEDVSEEVWNDFLDLRRKKRAPMTETALAGIKREAGKAGWSLEDVLAKCLARGWQGFEAGWVKDEPKPNGAAGQSDPLLRSIMARRSAQAGVPA